MSLTFDGFDSLDKMLKEAERAAESLEGEFTTLSIDPNNPQAAIAEMERVVDAKFAPYRGNPIVEPMAEASKEQFRNSILQRAEDAKRNSAGEGKE